MSKVLVIVHGAGKPMSDFYVKPVADLAAVLGHPPDCIPCWYADLSNIGSPVRGMNPEAEAFRRRFEEDLERQAAKVEGGEEAGPVARGLTSTIADVTDLVADVTRYLFDSTLQEPMRDRLRDAMRQAKSYDETVLVSHSLGTVLAYDVLREHADTYNVSHFMTMGCPLRKVVKAGARTGDVGKITEQTVAMWRNLYDTLDPVANAIGPQFPGYPIQDMYVHAGTLGIPAHDYWSRANVLQMIAGFLR
jgi:hypothetical protein